MTPMLTPQNVKDLLSRHDAYWESLRPRMREWKRIYMTEFWRDPNLPYGTSANGTTAVPLVTEVARTFALVEGYIGSIYARNPAVVMTPDLRGEGNPEVAQAVANEWLLRQRAQIEDASRLALIFPWAAVRLATGTSPDPLRRVTCTALPPWEVLVDDTAGSWDQQRWVGVISLVTVEDAVARFGKRRSSYRPRAYSRWLDSPTGIPLNGVTSSAMDIAQSGDDPGGGWVRIVEVYDLESDRLVVWSPDHDRDDRFLFKGVKVQTGASSDDPQVDDESPDAEREEQVETTYTGIPFRDAAGNPVVPIVPLYFSRDPEIPLRGYSLVGRVYPLVAELNLMRTYRLRGVRRMARQCTGAKQLPGCHMQPASLPSQRCCWHSGRQRLASLGETSWAHQQPCSPKSGSCNDSGKGIFRPRPSLGCKDTLADPLLPLGCMLACAAGSRRSLLTSSA